MSMSMVAMGSRATVFLVHALFWLLWLSSNSCNGVESDVRCLEGLHRALEDPKGYLTSWNFTNKSEGSICNFNGIECWHNDESKVLNIRLSNMELRGTFPLALKNCTSMTGLDLSANDLSGPLPQNISSIIPFVTSLDLSSNNFTGEIPSNLWNCSYLNILSLQHNGFSGQIPWQIGRLERLTQFSVADNRLSGPIPPCKKEMGAGSFANNLALCGKPLDDCKGPTKKTHVWVIVVPTIGGIVLAVIAVLFSFRKVSKRKKEEDVEGNKWAKSITGTKGIKISIFEKSVPKMRLFNLMKATSNFSKDNVMGSGKTGTMYKATLVNGTLLAVKRIQGPHHSEKHFISEMKTLGSIKHSNLVPLLGFCIARKERLLIYKFMPRGSLYQNLHQPETEPKFMEWPLRLQIAIGAARGLAWLHHCCSPRIIHCNISSKSILLDEDYQPKISDFGFAKFMNSVDTHASTSFDGKFCNSGVVAPEYMNTFMPSPKGDVYCFGKVMLELITGKLPMEVANAMQNFNGNPVEWIAYLSNYYAKDESSMGRSCDGEMLEFLRIAFACVSATPEERPTMLKAYQMLRAIHKSDDSTNEDEMLMFPNYITIWLPK